MNPFYEPFPETVRVGSEILPIRTDFREILKIMAEIEEAQGQVERLAAVLRLYLRPPKDLEEAVRAAADFVAGESEKQEAEEGGGKRKKAISYRKDAPYIIGDFLRFYGIDLTECPYLHWQKFQMLLAGLSEDSEIKKRIAYRLTDAGKIKNRQERARILRIQKAISIEDAEADEERIGELFGSLT